MRSTSLGTVRDHESLAHRTARCVSGAALAAALFAGAMLPARAAPVAAPVEAEIHALLERLAASDCRFKRNGSWHSAAEARKHLERKYDYLADRDAIRSTEQFIELAATRSSMSGRAYWVQCPGRSAIQSRTWLTALLQNLRSQSGATR